jgi:hypothetical protein
MIRLIGPNCYGIWNAPDYWLSDTSHGLSWAMLGHGQRLMFETKEKAQNYLAWLYPQPTPPMLGEGI